MLYTIKQYEMGTAAPAGGKRIGLPFGRPRESQRSEMRVATWSVVLAALPLMVYGVELCPANAADPAPQQQAQPAGAPSPSAGTPVVGASDPKTAVQGTVETDPRKMAQPAKAAPAPAVPAT